ncbi:MAG: hypothetical protein J07HN6_00690 [Halonotius sp. J07HN6]|nr:MAG: hypothetical protein J07HN6_00690 [Halonotius sp. J07HN6]
MQVSSTKGLDESSNQAIATETIKPGGSENIRIIVEPTSPGEYEMEAQAIYESVDGETSGATSQTVTFDVEEAAESADQTGQQTGGATDDDSPGFGISSVIVAFVSSVIAVLLRR